MEWKGETLDYAMKLDSDGWTVPEIVAELNKKYGLNYTKNKVRGKIWRMKNDGPPKDRETQIDRIDVDEFTSLRERGYTVDLLSKKFRVSTTTVRKFMKLHGIKSLGKRGRLAKFRWTDEERETILQMAEEGCLLKEMQEALPEKTGRQITQLLTHFRLTGALPEEGNVFEDHISEADLDLAKIMRSQGHSWDLIAMRLRRFTTEEVKQAATAAGIG